MGEKSKRHTEDSGTNINAVSDRASFIPATIETCNVAIHTGNGHYTATQKGQVFVIDLQTRRYVHFDEVYYLAKVKVAMIISESMFDLQGCN